jgi:hypothetical protein
MTGASNTVVLGAGIANVGGTVTLSGTATMATAGAALSGTNAIATLTATSPGTVTNGGTLTVGTALAGATGTLTNSGTLNIGGSCSIGSTSGGLSNSGAIAVTGSGAFTTLLAGFTNTGTIGLSGTGTIAGITNNAAGIVNLNSSGTITAFNNATATSTLNISSTPTVPTITTLTASASGNDVNYTASGTQTVNPTTYSNLTLSGSSLKTTTGITVNGILSMEGTATASAVPTYGGSATLQYKGSAAQTTGPEFPAIWAGTGGVKIENASGVTLGTPAKSIGTNPLTIGGTIAGTTFNDGGFQLTATGILNLTSGTFKLGASAAATTFPAFGTRNINAGTTVEYAATATQTIKGINYSNLTISGSGNNSKTADADITVNGVLNLASANASATQGCLDMSTYTLNIGSEAAIPATTIGNGDVTGIVKRAHTFDNNIPYSFGNQYTNITFLGFPGGVKPAWISCKIAIGTAPSWRNVALKRVYSFAQDGTGTDKVITDLHYLDSELNTASQTPYEPDETQLVLWDGHGGTPWTTNEPHGKTNNDATNNYISRSGFTMTYLAPTTTLDNKQLGLSYSNTTKNSWLGADLTDPTKWDVTTNWSAGYVPLTTEDVLIPGSLANYPTLTLDVEVKTIEIASGASFNAGSYNLTLNGSTGTWSNNGTFNGNSGTVTFSRGVISNVVSLSGSGTNNFNNITVNANTYLQPASGVYLKIAGAVTAGSGSIIDLKATNNTVEYNGSAQSIANLQGPASDIGYAHLVINSSGTTSLPATLNVMRDFTLTTGTAAASTSSTIDILGNVTLTAGTFTGSSAAISVGGNWTNNGATFTSGTSTVTFNSTSAAQSINGTATSQTFYNLVADKSSQTLSVGGSTTSLTVNNLTETSGNVSPPATLTINGNATLTAGTFTAGTTTTINGNWTNTAATFTAGSGTVAFTGSSAQTISGTNTFNNLTVNNAAGVTAAANQSVNGELYLQSGNVSSTQGTLELGSNSLTMGASATTTGTGDVTGIVTRNSFALNTPYSFGNQFTTISFTLDPLPTSISLKVVLSSAHTWKSDAIHRYYDIIRVGGSSATRLILNLHYLDTELNGITETNLNFFDNVLPSTVVDRGHSSQSSADNWLGLSGLGLPYVASTSFGYKYWTLGANSVGNTHTWISGGAVLTDWTLPGNWNGGVPDANSNVIIPAIVVSGTADNPTLPASTTINAIDIHTGATVNATTGSPVLTLAGSTGAWNNIGTFNAGTSTVVFTNAAATMSDPTNFYNVTVADGASLSLETNNFMRIAGTLSLSTSGVLNAASNHNTVEFNGTDQTIAYPNGSTPGYHNLILSGSGTKTMPASSLNIYMDLTLSGTASATAAQNINVTGNVTIGAGTTFNASSFSHATGGNWSNSGTFTPGTSTVTFNGGTAQTISGATTFNNLTINSAGVTSGADLTVNGALYLQSANASDVKGSLDMTDPYKLSLGISAVTTGSGDVTGIVRRAHTFVAGTSYTFNHPFTTMTFSGGGSYPSALEVKVKIGSAPSWKTSSIKRIDDFIRSNDGSGCTLTAATHYLDSELNGNDENKLVRFKYTPSTSTTTEVGRSANSTTDNWVANSNIDVATKLTTTYGWERTYANSDLPSLTWNGSVSTDFSNQNNWTPASTPTSLSKIIIPDASLTANDPTLPATTEILTLSINNGGILNSGNQTLTIAGTTSAWNNQGTFNAGTGTVVFSGNPADLSGTTDFYNLTINANARLATQSGAVIGIFGAVTINGTGGTKGIWSTISSGNTTIDYKGGSQTVVIPDASTNRYYNLILSGSGTKTMPVSALSIQGDFTISGTASVTASGALTIAGNTTFGSGTTFAAESFTHNLAGNLDNNGATLTATGSTFNLNGAAAQTIGGTSASTFENLTINNATGISLGSASTVGGTLTLTSGQLTLGNYNLTLNTTNAIAGSPSASKYIVYSGSGRLVKNITGTMASDFLLPIGTASNYSPATFRLTSGTVSGASVEINLTEGKQPNIGSAPNYINRYWTLTPTGFTSPVYNAALPTWMPM